MKYKIILFFLLFTIYYSLFTNVALAQHFVSPSYIIDWGNFNITSGKKTSTSYFLTDTVGQNAPGQYNSTGYIVKSGFQYIYDSSNQFSFIIDDLTVPLGTLVASIATTATNTITITTPSGHGYQIFARYNHPLSLITGTTIPDTSCNSGCTPDTSGVWNSASAYGFGFNAIGINSSGVATGIGTSDYFLNNTYFRPFSTIGQVIMSENLPVKNHSAKISYKANISSVQAAGEYENAAIFIAIPKY